MNLIFWRDLSMIWLSLLCFVALLPPVAALYFAVRGMHALHGRLHRWAGQAKAVSSKVHTQTIDISGRVSTPVIKLQSQIQRTETFLHKIIVGRS